MHSYSEDDWHHMSDLAIHNKNSLLTSTWAGCYYCLNVFSINTIQEFVDLEEDTALCPKCGIDAVVGDVTGYPVTDKGFLYEMHCYGFQNPAQSENDVKKPIVVGKSN